MSSIPVVAVFGYNNSRIYDLGRIRQLARNRLGAGLVLIKEDLSAADLLAADFSLDHRLEDPAVVDAVRDLLGREGLVLKGCLGFSDKGVIGAAVVARAFGLSGDDVDTAPAMLDKATFRAIERNLALDPEKYLTPDFAVIHAEGELRALLSRSGSFFIKPRAEGNSRGCMQIRSPHDLDSWLRSNSRALEEGVICETILAARAEGAEGSEYSFDCVDGVHWLTKKFTTGGAYRVEYQQIVPAPFDPERARSIHATLAPLLTDLGSRGGAFHHEFFDLPDGRLASVEPNRRPAGMWIWDLVGHSDPGFDPWARWLDWCGGRSSQSCVLRPGRFAGVRGVIARSDGQLEAIDFDRLEADLRDEYGENLIKVSLTKRAGDPVRAVPRDNSELIGLVSLRADSYEGLCRDLERAHEIFLSHVEVSPCEVG